MGKNFRNLNYDKRAIKREIGIQGQTWEVFMYHWMGCASAIWQQRVKWFGQTGADLELVNKQ